LKKVSFSEKKFVFLQNDMMVCFDVLPLQNYNS